MRERPAEAFVGLLHSAVGSVEFCLGCCAIPRNIADLVLTLTDQPDVALEGRIEGVRAAGSRHILQRKFVAVDEPATDPFGDQCVATDGSHLVGLSGPDRKSTRLNS